VTKLLLALIALAPLLLQADVRKLGNGAGPDSWTGDLTPIAPSDWTYERAAHLMERAGFGGTPREIDNLVKLGPEGAVDYLVDYQKIDNPLPPFQESGIFDDAMLPSINYHYADFTAALRAAYRQGEVYGVKPNPNGIRRFQPVIDTLYYRIYADSAEWRRAAQWWADRMLSTRRPLEEKLTLFWHGHFATEDAKVADYRLMLRQLAMLRGNANGNFRNLLLGIGQDPAMLIYLDARQNVKGQPNENFAREIMELFSLGVGNYTEKDIKEAARAFTGWDNDGLKFVIRSDRHDDGVKTILGKSGNFSGEDAVDILLDQKACAEFISRKLYRFLVREDLTPDLNAKIAAELRDASYELKPLLKTIFLSRDFYSRASFATQIKSPAQYVLSTYRKLGLTQVPGTPYFETVMSNLGQNLGNPPNVKGWDGGRNWVNPSTLLVRGNVVRHTLFPADAAAEYPRNVIPPRYRNAKEEVAERDKELSGAAPGPKNAGGMDSEGGMMMAPLSKKIGSAPDYDLKYGVYNGYTRTFQTVKPVPPSEAVIDLKAMLRSAGAKTSADAVDYFVARFLSVPLAAADRDRIVQYATTQLGATLNLSAANAEQALRDVLYVILSMPEYQLG
jgi:uncharacterized protein (DUF1800 family)